jgi:hypothetical protein
LEEEYTEAVVNEAEARRRIRDIETADDAKRLAAKRQVQDSMVSIMGSGAEAARLFGRQGFIVWKAQALAQAVVATALAVTRALAEGGPYAGPFLAAAVAAAGAVQIATIATTEPGYELGGYTGPGGKDQVAGFVHRGEYVFPKQSVDVLGRDFFQRLHNYSLGGMSSPISALPSYVTAASPALPGYSGGGLVTAPSAAARNVSIGFVEGRQDRRRWQERSNTRIMAAELARRGNRISV